MLIYVSTSPGGNLAQTAKTQALAGASAGLVLGVIHSVNSVRQSQIRDRYDVAAEGLTQVGTGAILGLLGATSAAVVGVYVAPIVGRGILAIAVPLVASAAITSSVHKPAERLVRAWSEAVVKGLKRILQRQRSAYVA